MLDIKEAKSVLDNCLISGCDYAEIFYEDTYKNTIRLMNDRVDSINTEETYGVGIRLLKGVEEVYGYSNDTSLKAMMSLSSKLAQSFDGKPLDIKFELEEETAEGGVNITRPSKDVSYSEKLPLLWTVYNTIKGYSPLIVQAVSQLMEVTQYVTIANTKGQFIHDTRNQNRISAQAIARHNGKSQANGDSIGCNAGFDYYKDKDLVKFATSIAHDAVEMVDAPDMVGGVYPVVMHNGFGGVLFHEACGHSLEASSVALGLSVFTGKKGTQIASSIVNAVDDGTLANEWGSTNVDDEGHKAQRNLLIKNGILNSYMIDMKNGRRMGEESTGSSRRESYKFSPTSRMTNTFICNGTDKFEDVIKDTKYGLFAKSLGGGSVNPVTGEFNFAVNVGYLIEDGKITTPVKGATLIGNGANALLNIDRICDNQTFGHGVCGASSGSVYANVGEPTIRILNMTVGGNGGRK